jgi:hypothetical protein
MPRAGQRKAIKPQIFWRGEMSKELAYLIELGRKHEITPAEKEEQRQSFAYGNTKIENPRITREVVALQANNLKISSGQ